jgi:phage tail P2-like protein
VSTVMPYADHLLPSNATPLEEAMAGAGKRIQAIPVPIDLIKRPLQTPATFVPFLAWERAVDIWNPSWDDSTKRNVIAASIALHFKKGTGYAIEQYVRYVGGRVNGWVRPPSRVFSGPSLTAAEREAWLAGLPQVRVYFDYFRGTAGRAKAFLGGWSRLNRSRNFFLAGTVCAPSIARQHLRRRATWHAGGVATATEVTDFGSYFQLHLAGQIGGRVFCDRAFGRAFYVPTDAWRRLVTIAPQTLTPWRIPVGPTLQAVTARPELVAEPGLRGRGVFTGSNFKHGTGSLMRRDFFVPSTSRYRLYERYAVYDGTIGLKRPNVQFMGVGRYGFPAHTAIMQVSVPSKRSRYAASGDGIFVPHTRFFIPHDPEPMGWVRMAVQAAKRLSDKILIQSGPTASFVAGNPFIAGTDHYLVGVPSA